jgi:hypothetical protein
LGDGFPMALPWAGREVPLTGRQIVNHPENSDKWYYPSGTQFGILQQTHLSFEPSSAIRFKKGRLAGLPFRTPDRLGLEFPGNAD